MKVRFRMKTKLLFIIAFSVILSSIFVGIYTGTKSVNSLHQTTEATLNSIADLASSRIETINTEELTLLHSLAEMPFIKDETISIEQKWAQLTPIIENNLEKYENLAYYNDKGLSARRTGDIMDFSDREYFRVPFDTGKDCILDPTLSVVTNEVYMYYSVPIKNHGKKVGALASMIRGNRLSEIAAGIDAGGGEHPLIINRKTGVIVGNGNSNENDEDITAAVSSTSDLNKIMENIRAGESAITTFIDPLSGKKKCGVYKPIPNTNWSIFCKADYDYYYKAVSQLNRNIMLSMIGAIIVSCILCGLIINVIMKPLISLKKSMEDIAGGNADLTKRIKNNAHDEIGDVVNAFNKFTEMLQGIMKDLNLSNTKLSRAGEDLTCSTQDTSSSITQIIANIESVHGQITNQSASVTQTASAVNQIASNIESLEKMIENQSSGVTQASAAVEEMMGNIASVNTSVDKMSESFSLLMQSAQNGSELQSDVNEKIENIKNQSETLQEANQAIAAIAEQTNLLAMNAAIEAAHAGEAGKGFSVVADEIRKLSETSGAQSKTIGEQLNSISSSIESVVKASEESSKAFLTVTYNIQSTDEIVRQIKAAMEEQNQGSIQINEALHSMNDSTMEVKNASKKMSEGNKAILQEVQLLQDATTTMKSSMDEMAVGARRINETGAALNGISSNMDDSIKDISLQVNKFRV